jgi:hypothetical protein
MKTEFEAKMEEEADEQLAQWDAAREDRYDYDKENT